MISRVGDQAQSLGYASFVERQDPQAPCCWLDRRRLRSTSSPPATIQSWSSFSTLSSTWSASSIQNVSAIRTRR